MYGNRRWIYHTWIPGVCESNFIGVFGDRRFQRCWLVPDLFLDVCFPHVKRWLGIETFPQENKNKKTEKTSGWTPTNKHITSLRSGFLSLPKHPQGSCKCFKVVVSNIFLFSHRKLGKISNLTNAHILQMGCPPKPPTRVVISKIRNDLDHQISWLLEIHFRPYLEKESGDLLVFGGVSVICEPRKQNTWLFGDDLRGFPTWSRTRNHDQIWSNPAKREILGT